MPGSLTNEEKKRLSNERQKAVRDAWKEEKERVKNGQGTRDWYPSQQKELLQRGAVSGYEGHHMKSVSLYPEYAGDPKNIQFLSEEEHLDAHQGNYHNPTNGYYDPNTQTMNEFQEDDLEPVPVINLSNCCSNENDDSIAPVREAYVSAESSYDNKPNSEALDDAKATYLESQSTETEGENSGQTENCSNGQGMGR